MLVPPLLEHPDVRLACVVTVLALAAASPATADDRDFDGYFGIGFGGGPSLGGELGESFSGGSAHGGLRLGMRFDRLGIELTFRGTSLETELDLVEPSYVAWRPALAVYLVASRPLQLLVRGGVGFGWIQGTRTMEVPCTLAEECGTRLEETLTSYAGVSLDAGVVAQVHLGRRRGQHGMLWAELGASALRFQIEDTTLAGHAVDLTFGVALAFD